MKIVNSLADDAILQELGRRLAAVRLNLNLTQAALAEQAGVAKRTIERLESGQVATQLSGFVRVCRALNLLDRLDLLLPEISASPIEILKLHGRQRRRASNRAADTQATKPWRWADP